MYNQLISFIEQRATSQTAFGGQLPYQGSLANCGLRAYKYMHNVITIVPGGRPTWAPTNCGPYVYAA